MDRYGIVLGNGPSLKGFDFRRLDGFDALGMNAAYRFWDRIGWYPAYYCCLDDQLIETHHGEIDRLFAEGKVREIFVHGRFFELHPERIGHPHFYSLDQALPHWSKKRGEKMGLTPLYEHPAFKTSDTRKVTTGAFATRFMAFKGYRNIALMGIDLRYVEILPEAEQAGGVALVMKATPAVNPNYFFDDYQRAGDRYNIPNPAAHAGNLHLQSFKVLQRDFLANDVPSRIVNTNPASILNDRAVFPLVALPRVLEEPMLGAVFVPTNAGEKDQILANLKLWNRPDFLPFSGRPARRGPKLVFVFNNDGARHAEADIRAEFEAQDLGRFFSELSFIYLDLEGERDAYRRDYRQPVGDDGYKAGPNNQFVATVRLMREHGPYAFLMETDCVPLRPDWLGHLEHLLAHAEPFWIMGSAYRGIDTLTDDFRRHINGNAVYAVGDPAFQSFVDTFWEPRLRAAVKSEDKRLAYDCILEREFSRPGKAAPDIWALWQANAHRLRYTGYIQNLSARRDLAEIEDNLCARLLRDHPETFVVHSKAVAVAAAKLLAESADFDAAAIRTRRPVTA